MGLDYQRLWLACCWYSLTCSQSLWWKAHLATNGRWSQANSQQRAKSKRKRILTMTKWMSLEADPGPAEPWGDHSLSRYLDCSLVRGETQLSHTQIPDLQKPRNNVWSFGVTPYTATDKYDTIALKVSGVLEGQVGNTVQQGATRRDVERR